MYYFLWYHKATHAWSSIWLIGTMWFDYLSNRARREILIDIHHLDFVYTFWWKCCLYTLLFSLYNLSIECTCVSSNDFFVLVSPYLCAQLVIKHSYSYVFVTTYACFLHCNVVFCHQNTTAMLCVEMTKASFKQRTVHFVQHWWLACKICGEKTQYLFKVIFKATAANWVVSCNDLPNYIYFYFCILFINHLLCVVFIT